MDAKSLSDLRGAIRNVATPMSVNPVPAVKLAVAEKHICAGTVTETTSERYASLNSDPSLQILIQHVAFLAPRRANVRPIVVHGSEHGNGIAAKQLATHG